MEANGEGSPPPNKILHILDYRLRRVTPFWGVMGIKKARKSST